MPTSRRTCTELTGVLLLALIFAGGCDDGPGTPDSGSGMDAGPGAPDGAVPGDAASDADGGGDAGDDAGGLGDAGAGCSSGEHECPSGCTAEMANDPANGCALGCGDPCPQVDAICNPDGTCGTPDCTPTTCALEGVQCGLIDNGCGSRVNCGACDAAGGEICMAGTCVAQCDPPDSYEPNASRAGLSSLATLNDFNNDMYTIVANLHDDADEDWYQFDIVDGGAGGNPLIDVLLSDTPAGSDWEVAAFFDCTDADLSDNLTSCDQGAPDNSIERGCTSAGQPGDRVILATECDWTTDESGTLWVRVRSATFGMCSEYTLEVSVT